MQNENTEGSTQASPLPPDKDGDTQSLYRSLFDAMREGVSVQRLVYGPDGQPQDYRIIQVNAAYERELGIPAAKAIGALASELYGSGSAPLLGVFARVARNQESTTFDYEMPEKGLYLRVSAFSPEPDVFATVFENVSDQRRFDARLANIQRVESLGLLAGGIAHDFNNLLGGIFGYMELARSSLAAESYPKALGYLDKSLAVFNRARELTQQLLTFSKGGQPRRVAGDLGAAVKSAVELSLSGSNLALDFSMPEDLLFCEYDEGQIGQAVDNIAINAIQAMPKGGRLAVALSNESLKADNGLGLDEGRYVRIDISDQGPGIPREHLGKLFDPFFTTKENAAGLGLATAYSIIRKHEGTIDVRTEQGKGSTFSIYLPGVRRAAAAPRMRPALGGRVHGSVLIMDDEDFMRDMGSEMLSAMGFTVRTARDGEEALNAFRKSLDEGKPFDAIILDLTVPGGMGGRDAAMLIRDLSPHVVLIASSGYSDDPVMADPPHFGFTASLKKPYARGELAEVLARWLGR
jgi:signal transduction histidine kinase